MKTNYQILEFIKEQMSILKENLMLARKQRRNYDDSYIKSALHILSVVLDFIEKP